MENTDYVTNKANMIQMLMAKYCELLKLEQDYRLWLAGNPAEDNWAYNGNRPNRPTKAEFNRIRLMLQKDMLEIEKVL